MALDKIVTHYILHYRDNARAEMRFFQIQRNPAAALQKAALCLLPSGKRHPHQRRIPRNVLEEAESRLRMMAKDLAHASDFATLHRLVDREIGFIQGIGPLTVYDIAHRVGAYFKKAPTLVYLHAGTRTGAAALGFGGDSIHPSELLGEFSRLTAPEIEDCLCIYKDQLRPSQRSKHLGRASFCAIA